MKSSGRSAFIITAAAALLTGCGARVAVPEGPATTPRADGERSWMLPEAKREDLLYVSDAYASKLFVYSYPSLTLVGTVSLKEPTGECVDKSGNVWVTEYASNEITEFPHGGTTSISVLNTVSLPTGCSVDPASNNLAVAGALGELDVFPSEQGPPATYSDSELPRMFFCAYDDNGNLFVDGYQPPGSETSVLGELTKGSSRLANVSLSEGMVLPGSIQWHGSHLAIHTFADLYHVKAIPIDRVRVEGQTGTVVGTTWLGRACCERWVSISVQYWIQGNAIIGPDDSTGGGGRGSRQFALWKYPMGGKPTKVVHVPGADLLFGVVISPAPAGERNRNRPGSQLGALVRRASPAR